MISNADITIYNHYKDKETERVIYKRTVIKNVNWQEQRLMNLVNKTVESADTIMIFIPFLNVPEDKQYIEPKAWRRLLEDDKDKYFTFAKEDIVVKGICDFEITGEKGADLQAIKNNYDNVVSVISVIICDNGSPTIRHWEVGCK